jgi:hypothetical protein
MPNANYAVTGSIAVDSTSAFSTGFRTPAGFSVYCGQPNVGNVDLPFSLAVFSSNALPPTGGTGTDSWGSVQADGTIDANFNVASVTKTATGIYDVVFTTSMPTQSYAIQTTCNSEGSSSLRQSNISAQSTTGFTVNTFSSGGGADDFAFSFTVNATNATLPVTVTAEELKAVTNNWYRIDSDSNDSILTTKYKVEMQDGIVFAGGKAGITRDGELYFTSNGGKYLIAVNEGDIGLTRIDSAY